MNREQPDDAADFIRYKMYDVQRTHLECLKLIIVSIVGTTILLFYDYYHAT